MTATAANYDDPVEAPSRALIERSLLALGALFMIINTTSLVLLRGQGAPLDWAHVIIWIACAVIGTQQLERRLPKRDPLLFPLAMFMTGWGLILIERLAPPFAERQTVWLPIAFAAGLAAAFIPNVIRILRAYRYTLLVFGLLLLIATIVMGTNPSGVPNAPELWLGYGTFFFQPSEALKIILVVFLASYLAEQYPAMRAAALVGDPRRVAFSPRILGPILLMWGLSIVILIWQRDLGTAMLFFIVFLLLTYIASGFTPLLLAGAALTALAGIVGYRLFAVVRLRVDIWLNPWPEADARAYQIVQSLQAFAAGGIFGQGIGQGTPVFIPVNHSDFIFAALAEEFGLLGVIACIACLGIFIVRGLRIAAIQRARPFHTLLAVGLSVLLLVQSLMIMGGVMKLIPLTGVTMPFFSYGGSSLLINFIAMGLLLRLSSGDP